MNLARSRPRVTAIAVTLGIAGIVVAVVLRGGGGPVTPDRGAHVSYADDRPPVAVSATAPLRVGVDAVTVPGRSGFLAWWSPAEPTVTFGFPVCVTEDQHATVTDVSALKQIGDDFEVVGILLHDVPVSAGGAVEWTTSSAGFPPDELADDGLLPAMNATVTAICGPPLERSQELLIGLRATGPGGGGWRGAVVTYTVPDGEVHELEVPVESVLCGTATEPCGELDS